MTGLGPLGLAAALGCAAAGGVFFAFSTFVMRALSRIPPPAGIAAMQAINAVILGPWFLGLFFGTAAACAWLTGAALLDPDAAASPWHGAGGALYLLGAVGVTVTRNVPLNRALDAVAPDAEDGPDRWSEYVRRWTLWNHIRTVASLGSAALLLAAPTGPG